MASRCAEVWVKVQGKVHWGCGPPAYTMYMYSSPILGVPSPFDEGVPLGHPILYLGGSNNTQSVMGISGHLVIFGLMVRHLISIRYIYKQNFLSKEEWL